MCKLQTIFLIIFILVGLAGFISYPCVASPTQIPKASIDVTTPTLFGWTVPYGQKIEFKVRVCVKSDSPVPLDGFYISISLKKPGGRWVYTETIINDKIYPGQCRNYDFKLDYVADKTGTWKYVVALYTKDKKHKLDEDTGTFEVYAVPKAEVSVSQIVGWVTAASMICAGLAFILSRIIIR